MKTPLASEEAAQRKDNVGHLSAQLLFDNFSLGVFGQLPRDLQEMLHVGGEEEEEDYDGVCVCVCLFMSSVCVFVHELCVC